MVARIPRSDKDLLAECIVETFGASGPGGQHVNKRATAVRLRHIPTGVVVTCQQERRQYRNKRIALANLRRKLTRLLHRPRRRIPTAIPQSARRRTLDDKHRRSRRKQLRQPPHRDD